MPFQIYLAPQIGNGVMSLPATWTESVGPYRSLLSTFVNVAAGDRYWEIDHPARRVSICCVSASDAALDAMEADSRVKKVLPSRPTDAAALAALLRTLFSSYSSAWRTAATTFLEGHGVNLEWVGVNTTLKEIVAHLVRLFLVCQMADGARLSNVKSFLAQNIDLTVAQVPAAQRTAVANWLISKGIDTSWITGTTMVRQVVNSLPGNALRIYGRDVVLRFAGEEM